MSATRDLSSNASASKPYLFECVETLLCIRLFTVIVIVVTKGMDVVDPEGVETFCVSINTLIWGAFLVVVIGRLLELRSLNYPVALQWNYMFGLLVDFLRRWRCDSAKVERFRCCKTMVGWRSFVHVRSGFAPQKYEIARGKDAGIIESTPHFSPVDQQDDMILLTAPQRLSLDRGETETIVPIRSPHKHSKDQ
jgi:hypothetical protein